LSTYLLLFSPKIKEKEKEIERGASPGLVSEAPSFEEDGIQEMVDSFIKETLEEEVMVAEEDDSALMESDSKEIAELGQSIDEDEI